MRGWENRQGYGPSFWYMVWFHAVFGKKNWPNNRSAYWTGVPLHHLPSGKSWIPYYVEKSWDFDRDRTDLGSGHLPLSRSSSMYFCSTSWHLCRSADTARRLRAPSSVAFPLVMNENCRSVSKHALEKSSRNLRLESVSVEIIYHHIENENKNTIWEDQGEWDFSPSFKPIRL